MNPKRILLAALTIAFAASAVATAQGGHGGHGHHPAQCSLFGTADPDHDIYELALPQDAHATEPVQFELRRELGQNEFQDVFLRIPAHEDVPERELDPDSDWQFVVPYKAQWVPDLGASARVGTLDLVAKAQLLVGHVIMDSDERAATIHAGPDPFPQAGAGVSRFNFDFYTHSFHNEDSNKLSQVKIYLDLSLDDESIVAEPGTVYLQVYATPVVEGHGPGMMLLAPVDCPEAGELPGHGHEHSHGGEGGQGQAQPEHGHGDAHDPETADGCDADCAASVKGVDSNKGALSAPPGAAASTVASEWGPGAVAASSLGLAGTALFRSRRP